MDEDYTTIRIYGKDWQRINAQKRPGDDFADAVARLLDRLDDLENRVEELEQQDVKPRDTDESGVVDERDDTGWTKDTDAHADVSAADEPMQTSVFSSQIEDEVEAAIRGFEPSTQSTADEWMPALEAAFEHLRDHGPVSKKQFTEDVFPVEPAGYSNQRTWWRKIIKPGLEEIPGVIKPQGGGSWRYKPD